ISALLELYPKGMAGFRRFMDLLAISPDIKDKKGAKQVKDLKGDIAFNHVTFTYEKTQKPVLNDISFQIESGKTIAFVGPSGAGKTTICSLIPRFYDVNNGSVTIDGIDIRDMTMQSLRKQIGIVQQDVFLFTGTLKENIMYGKLDATDEEIARAVKQAHMEDFIAELPNGYETQVGERGLKLSGGQKQRIAIARVFLINPPILILDEATSALDLESESIIQETLLELSNNRTTIIVAHRLSTITHADRIFVMSNGEIEESGTHLQLMNRQGAYYDLYSIQNLYYSKGEFMSRQADISFLQHDTLEAAKELLGKEIITEIDGEVTSGFITEVEAYLGLDDRAAHTFGGRVTKKNEKMFNSSGHIYVYSMHGHNCMNFLTREKEYPEGVLIRGIEPNIGEDVMARRRGREYDLTTGPGKLTKALGIKRDLHNGMELNNGILTLAEGKIPAVIVATKRIGIDTKEEAVDFPYR